MENSSALSLKHGPDVAWLCGQTGLINWQGMRGSIGDSSSTVVIGSMLCESDYRFKIQERMEFLMSTVVFFVFCYVIFESLWGLGKPASDPSPLHPQRRFPRGEHPQSLHFKHPPHPASYIGAGDETQV